MKMQSDMNTDDKHAGEGRRLKTCVRQKRMDRCISEIKGKGRKMGKGNRMCSPHIKCRGNKKENTLGYRHEKQIMITMKR